MRKIALVWVLVLALMLVAAPASAGNNGNNGDNGNAPEKTWVCHHTHSDSNPIILVHVKNGWDKGHGNQKVSKHQIDDEVATGYDGKAGPAEKRGFEGDCGEPPQPS